MKVSVSVKGRFHAFSLARELATRGALARLITTMPRFLARSAGIPPERVRSLAGLEVAARAAARLPTGLRPGDWFDRALHDAVARAIARHLPADADVHVAWSGVALPAIRRARALGAISIVERGSSHILDQRERLERAARDAGVAIPGVREHTVERELREYEEADFIAVPGTFVRNTFLARGIDEGRLLTVPYGVDTRRFHPAPAPPPGFRVMFCGTAGIQKGSHHLLEAFGRLVRGGATDAELVFVGPREPALDRFVARFGDDRVRFLGRQRDAIPALYREASVFCIPSVQDGFPLAHLEALASGLPVVASRSTGCVDTVVDGLNGHLVDAGDVDALSARFAELHGDPARRARMGLAARRTAEDHSWERYGDRAIAAYSRARDRRRGGPESIDRRGFASADCAADPTARGGRPVGALANDRHAALGGDG